jgi:hypothetical protein
MSCTIVYYFVITGKFTKFESDSERIAPFVSKLLFAKRMRIPGKILLLFTVLSFCFFSFQLDAQEEQKKPTRQSSYEAYSNGDYEKAYKEFSELLLVYTKDPLYKYYSGVCLVKMNKEPLKASELIDQSLKGASPVKSVSDDAWFYLGRARQMSGNYLSAIEAYNVFTDQSGKKKAKELNVPQYIQECRESKGAIAEPVAPVAVKTEEVKKEPVPVENKPAAAAVPLVASVPAKNAAPRMSVSSEYELILSQALDYQVKADSLTALAEKEKANLDNLPSSEKQKSVAVVSAYEAQALSFQKQADAKYNEARIAMNPQQQKQVTTPASQVSSSEAETQKETSAGTSVAVAPGKTMIFEAQARPVSDPNAKVSIDPTIPDGLIYRIQMGVFRNPVSPSYFKGLTPVYGFRVAGTDRTSYYVGMFRKIDDARQALNTVKVKGFKDSFVVALLNGKTVSADRAASLEKEWANKPFENISGNANDASADTIPPELRYRVEVARPAKPLKDDAVEALKKVAGSRGLDIKSTDDSKTAYLIGKFITFESAAEYSSLLVRNGYPDARVVAWLGEKEISVDRAKQLFEN